MQRVSIFFAFLTRGVGAPKCSRLTIGIGEDGSIDDSTLAILDASQLTPEEVKFFWRDGSYLDMHQKLWKWEKAGVITKWDEHEQAIYNKITQMSSHNPSIEDIHVVEAIVKDMSVLDNKVEMRAALAGFDFPSLFKLCSKNEVRPWGPGSDKLRDTLISLLREKVVPWITTTDHLSTISMDVFRSWEHQKIVYDVLSSLEDVNIVVQSFDVRALLTMKNYISSVQNPIEYVKASIDLQLSKKLEGFQDWFEDNISEIETNVKLILVIIRSIQNHDVVYEAITIQPEILLNLRDKLKLEGSNGGVNFGSELRYIDKTLFAKSLRHFDLYPALHFDDTPATIFSILKNLEMAERQDALNLMEYHDLLRLRTKYTPQDTLDTMVANLIREIEDRKFESWLTEVDYNLGGGTTGWAGFLGKSTAFLERSVAEQVLKQIVKFRRWEWQIDFPKKLQYMDYFSLLLLKDTISRSEEIPSGLDAAIDSLLAQKKTPWMRWLTTRVDDLVTDAWDATNLLAVLPVLPDKSWLSLDHILSLHKTVADYYLPTQDVAQVENPEYLEPIHPYFIEHLKTLAASDLVTIKMIFADPDKIDEIVQLLDFLSSATILSTIRDFNYDHLLVLSVGASDSVRLQHVIRNLLNDNSARYYQPVDIEYVVPDIQGELQYLSLLQVMHSPRGHLFEQAINNLLSLAKTRWRIWFNEHGSDVITDRSKLRTLLGQLLLVPEAEYLLTPPEISRLGDQIRVWYPNLESVEDNSVLPQYWKFIEHAKKYGSFRNSDQPHDEMFRTHIWQHEQNDNFDVLVSVRFDREILSARRSDVYDAIDWMKVQNHLSARQDPDDGMRQPPRKRQKTDHDSLALTFLVDDMEQNALPNDWFNSV